MPTPSQISKPIHPRERREYGVAPVMGGVETLAAEYQHHVFPRHVQEQAVVGLVERGSIQFVGGGIDEEIREGDILYIAPGVAHEALGRGDGSWTYRAFYLTPDQWGGACSRLSVTQPRGASVLRNPALYNRIRATHRGLIAPSVSERLFEETLDMLVSALAEHESSRALRRDGAFVTEALERVRQELDLQPTQRLTLAQMAALSGLSRFHFLRAFTRAYGVSPYAYSLNRRLLVAQRLLSAGERISMTALEVGFADQAHLTRHFLRTIGVTPGEYQRAFA